MNKTQKIIVSGILETKEGVLLAKRPMTKKIAPGVYHLPGGHVEFAESPEAALVREYKEEFYLDIKVDKIVRAFSYLDGDSHTIGITYKIEVDNLPSVVSFDARETEEISWVTSEKVSDFLVKDGHDYKTVREFFGLGSILM